jgi:RimJ/RimL family protein N-acetyltransferase
MTFAVSPVSLEARHTLLVPLARADAGDLWAAAAPDLSIFDWYAFPMDTREKLDAFVEAALKEQTAGVSLPFATVERASGKVVGTTRFGNIDRANRRAEIGWTWLGKSWQRSALNTEAKYLMLRHAFETWRCIRVELKTDALNTQSRAAILRLGAKEEGILRRHMTTAMTRFRDTVYYSVLDDEWPAVKAGLEAKLARKG